MGTESTNKIFSDRDREILKYTRTSIFERRKTQYVLLLFYLGVVGVCTSLVLNNYKPPQLNNNLILIFLFPIVIIIPLHTLIWYHALKIEQLDAERRLIIAGLKPWQSKMGIISFSVTFLLPLFALPILSGFLLYDGKKSLFETFHFISVILGAVVVCLVAIIIEIYGHCQTNKIKSNRHNQK